MLIPADVVAAVIEAYKPEGVVEWLTNWIWADATRRARMEALVKVEWSGGVTWNVNQFIVTDDMVNRTVQEWQVARGFGRTTCGSDCEICEEDRSVVRTILTIALTTQSALTTNLTTDRGE